MAQANRRRTYSPQPENHFSKRMREGLVIVTAGISVFILLALLSYHRSDPSWSHAAQVNHVANIGGKVGAVLSDITLYLLGYLAYLFPFMLIYGAWVYFRAGRDASKQSQTGMLILRTVGFVFVLVAGCGLASLLIASSVHLPFSAGGVLGNLVGLSMQQVFNHAGSTLILLAVFLSAITLFTGLSWLYLADQLGRGAYWFVNFLFKSAAVAYRTVITMIKTAREKTPVVEKSIAPEKPKIMRVEPTIKKEPPPIMESKPKPSIVVSKPKPIQPSLRSQQERQTTLFQEPMRNTLPSLSALDAPVKSKDKGYTNDQLEDMSREVEARLNDFGVEVKVVAVHPGPVVTRFELQLAAGTKVVRVSNLAKDLARSLAVSSVRIVDVIPGKPVIGLELPNLHREIVRLREVLSSKQYESARSPLSLALGKDIAGHPMIVDLAKMPHLLIAGTTGSGKSVCMNAVLLSFLYKATPEQLRLILIDPKMLELSIYEGIPHLLTPVVTDMKDAASSLRWCVAEMDRRYQLMASLGVRNISGYNTRVKEARKKGAPLLDPLKEQIIGEDPEELQELPYIVVLADEFADMMMVVGKKVEELIARLAQKARAAGIHLILATQRPSVDVITGLIKANIPTRISFQVSSKIDSRTVLDQAGAEQLLGHGDMLYLAPGSGVPVRVHGAFVDDAEVHRVVKELKQRGAPNYIEEILTAAAGDGDGIMGDSDAEQDPLYDQAVQIIIETRRASISSIQRRLKIGYNRAARIVEAMEAAGLVGPMEGSGAREVLIPEAE